MAILTAARHIALFLSFVFGMVALSLGANAVAKTNTLKDYVYAKAPSGVNIHINIADAENTAIVAAVGGALLAVMSCIALVYTLVSTHLSSKVLRILACLHFFFCAWIFASLVPYVDFAANRTAKVTAYEGDVPLTAAQIGAFAQSIGVKVVYWDLNYLRNMAILPWIAILFGVISGVLLLFTAGTDESASYAGAPAMSEKKSNPNNVV